MLQRILVPLDGSERAERGLTMAARLARGSGGARIIARIVNTPPFPLAPYGEPAQIALALIDTAREEADDLLLFAVLIVAAFAVKQLGKGVKDAGDKGTAQLN